MIACARSSLIQPHLVCSDSDWHIEERDCAHCGDFPFPLLLDAGSRTHQSSLGLADQHTLVVKDVIVSPQHMACAF